MVLKRVFDFALALALALPALLICLLVAPLIWMDCRASPLFLQTRVGRNQRPFKIAKLRTMRADTRDLASHDVSSAQITRTGHLFRRLKFDELPQIWNVLTGDMSFVGPRPCLPSQQELIAERTTRDVYAIRPGITGLAQVAGIDMSTPVLLAETDARYAQNWSFSNDIRILAQTFAGRGRGDAAKV